MARNYFEQKVNTKFVFLLMPQNLLFIPKNLERAQIIILNLYCIRTCRASLNESIGRFVLDIFLFLADIYQVSREG